MHVLNTQHIKKIINLFKLKLTLFNYFFFKKIINYYYFFFKNINLNKCIFLDLYKKDSYSINLLNLIKFNEKKIIDYLIFKKKKNNFLFYLNQNYDLIFLFTKNKFILNKIANNALSNKIIINFDLNLNFLNFFFFFFNFKKNQNFFFFFFLILFN